MTINNNYSNTIYSSREKNEVITRERERERETDREREREHKQTHKQTQQELVTMIDYITEEEEEEKGNNLSHMS